MRLVPSLGPEPGYLEPRSQALWAWLCPPGAGGAFGFLLTGNPPPQVRMAPHYTDTCWRRAVCILKEKSLLITGDSLGRVPKNTNLCSEVVLHSFQGRDPAPFSLPTELQTLETAQPRLT